MHACCGDCMLGMELTHSDDNPESVLSQKVVEWVDDHKQHSYNDGHCHLFDKVHTSAVECMFRYLGSATQHLKCYTVNLINL